MTDLRKAAEIALEFVEWLCGDDHSVKPKNSALETREALRQALAQPEYQTVSAPQPQTFTGQAPVAWEQFHTPDSPLYTAPSKREWVGLTDEEIAWCYIHADFNDHYKAIEAKLKEKNT